MKRRHQSPVTEPAIHRTGGFCKRCGVDHRLGPGNTQILCQDLMGRLDLLGTIDLFSLPPGNHAAFSTDSLFGEERGKMFGVMECLQTDGTSRILYAFSGQYNGSWLVEGWVPPIFDIDLFLSLTIEREKRIKALGRAIDGYTPHSYNWLAKRKERRQLSRTVMREIQDLYRFTNFRGKTADLREVFSGNKGIPTGTGDCCAPKLLHFAVRNNLYPLGISEFFWGRENQSGSHRHGSFASACVEKCEPILGFMLCGLEECRQTNRTRQ